MLIGDTSQHQGVDAGKPFEQMQAGGMQTSMLDKIMRQKDPELLKAVEHLSRNETEQGIKLLSDQGRITQIVDPAQRIDAIAKDYASQPEKTLVVSPDNKSRQQINEAIRTELQGAGSVSKENHTIGTLTQRSDMTGADRTWAGRYNVRRHPPIHDRQQRAWHRAGQLRHRDRQPTRKTIRSPCSGRTARA